MNMHIKNHWHNHAKDTYGSLQQLPMHKGVTPALLRTVCAMLHDCTASYSVRNAANSFMLPTELHRRDGLDSCPPWNKAGPAGGKDVQPGGEVGKDLHGNAVDKVPRQKSLTECIQGKFFTVMRCQGKEATLCLKCNRCNGQRRVSFQSVCVCERVCLSLCVSPHDSHGMHVVAMVDRFATGCHWLDVGATVTIGRML